MLQLVCLCLTGQWNNTTALLIKSLTVPLTSCVITVAVLLLHVCTMKEMHNCITECGKIQFGL